MHLTKEGRTSWSRVLRSGIDRPKGSCPSPGSVHKIISDLIRSLWTLPFLIQVTPPQLLCTSSHKQLCVCIHQSKLKWFNRMKANLFLTPSFTQNVWIVPSSSQVFPFYQRRRRSKNSLEGKTHWNVAVKWDCQASWQQFLLLYVCVWEAQHLEARAFRVWQRAVIFCCKTNYFSKQSKWHQIKHFQTRCICSWHFSASLSVSFSLCLKTILLVK